MWRLRKLLAGLLSGSSSGSLKKEKNNTPLRILAYHRIGTLNENYPLDGGVVSTTPENFEAELKFIVEHFNVINFRSLKEHFDQKKELPPRSLIITFDDGYRDNYSIAFPLLQKYKLTATIFLSIQHIETGALYWWDIASYYLKKQKKTPQEIRTFLKELKTITNTQRIYRIKKLGDENLKDIDRQSLTWDEVKIMHNAGIEFGSHTMTHPILAQVQGDTELDFELKESKKVLEQKLGEKVVSFSYPTGGANAFNARTKQKVKEAGYSFAVSYMHGINSVQDIMSDPFELKRLDMDELTITEAKSKLAFPWIYAQS